MVRGCLDETAGATFFQVRAAVQPRETFDEIVQDLHNHMVEEITNWKDPVAVDKRVALGLYHFAHGNDWAITGAKFDLAGPTAYQITWSFQVAQRDIEYQEARDAYPYHYSWLYFAQPDDGS
ncbi:hypothetical protein WJX77_012461 [Trebouxia sp. C0004]